MRRVLLFGCLITFASTCFAQFSYAPINVPGAVVTVARGVNSSGEIVGFYMTATCQYFDIYNATVTNCPTKGFKYVNGSYIKLMVPNSVSTIITGVNDYGDLVGYYKKSDGTYHGFIWYHQNVVKTIDYPGLKPPYLTVPMGINKAGTVVGGIWSISSTGTFPYSGWVWVNGSFSNMNPTAPNAGSPCCWSVNGISNNGIIAGQVFQNDWNQAWLKQSSDEDFFMAIRPGSIGTDTFATAVNSATDMVGYGFEGWFAPHIEANEGSGDFTEVKPTFIQVKYPNSTQTVPYGVNDLRAIVGAYTDSAGKTHGFFAK